MASKLAAAKIAAWSGVRAVIASAALPGVVTDALAGRAGRHVVRAARAAARRAASSGSRSPRASEGKIVVDAGARRALVERRQVAARRPACASVEGDFDADATVEIVDDDGAVFAKGLCRYTSQQLQRVPRPPHRRSPRRLPPRGRPPRRPRRPPVIPSLARVAAALATHPADAGVTARKPPDLTERSRGSLGRMTSAVEELGERAKAASRLLGHRVDLGQERAPCSRPPTCCSSGRPRSRPPTTPTSRRPRPGAWPPGPLDRLRLTDARLAGMANGLRTVAGAARPGRRGARRLDPAQRARRSRGCACRSA